jgi:hypothetical protein
LLDAPASVPDTRGRRGRPYEVSSILALAVVAMLRGSRGSRAMARWGRLDNRLAPAPGFTRPTRGGRGWRPPCFGELAAVFAAPDAAAVAAALRRGVAVPGVAEPPRRAVALDGEAVRGRRRGDVPGAHRLAAYGREAEAVPARRRVPAATDEHKTAPEPLQGHPAGGGGRRRRRGVLPARLRRGGRRRRGGYVVTVEANQPAPQEAIATGFARASSPGGARPASARRPGRGRR